MLKLYMALWRKLDHKPTNMENYSRGLAFIVDWILSSVFISLPVTMAHLMVFQKGEASIYIDELPFPVSYIAGGLTFVFAFLYYVYVPYKVYKGQTLGKRLLKLQITMEDGEEVTFKALMIRYLFVMTFLETTFIPSAMYVQQLLSLIIGFDITFVYSIIGTLVCMLSIFLAFKAPSRRMLHDYFAHTTQVDLQKIEEEKKKEEIKRLKAEKKAQRSIQKAEKKEEVKKEPQAKYLKSKKDKKGKY